MLPNTRRGHVGRIIVLYAIFNWSALSLGMKYLGPMMVDAYVYL